MSHIDIDFIYIKLLRLVRLPKLFEMTDVENFDKRMDCILRNYGNYRIVIKFYLQIFFKLFRLLMIATFLTYILGCLWYLILNDVLIQHYPEENFIKFYHLNSNKNNTAFDK